LIGCASSAVKLPVKKKTRRCFADSSSGSTGSTAAQAQAHETAECRHAAFEALLTVASVVEAAVRFVSLPSVALVAVRLATVFGLMQFSLMRRRCDCES
jgi:hypothetical protein